MLNACTLMCNLERRANFGIRPIFLPISNNAFQPYCFANLAVFRCGLLESDLIVVMGPVHGVGPIFVYEAPVLRKYCKADVAEHNCVYDENRL